MAGKLATLLTAALSALQLVLAAPLDAACPVAQPVSATPQDTACPAFKNGSFTIHEYQLYSENADFDTKNCILYLGSLFNSTVVVYDPYKGKTLDVIKFEGLSNKAGLNVGSVVVDKYTGLLSVVVNAMAPFITGGKDVSGDNFLVKYDAKAKQVVWKANITAVTGGTYGGFQDVEHDVRGNTYVVGTFPGTIIKIDKTGKTVEPWYVPAKIITTAAGYEGLAAIGDLLLANTVDGQIDKFDLAADKGTPVRVARSPTAATLADGDAIKLPSKYGGKVALVAEDSIGIAVFKSKDGWKTVDYAGTIANNFSAASGGASTAAIDIAGSIFILEEYFTDEQVPGTSAGNRSSFPFIDITSQVDSLVGE